MRVQSDGTGRLEVRNAAGQIRTWGTELLARYHRGPIHLTATHVHTNSTEGSTLTGTTRRTVPLTPDHTLGLVGAYEVEDRGRFGVELYYTGEQSLENNPYRVSSPSHWILGFLVERRMGRMRFFVNAENVLDTRQTTYDPLLRPARTPDGEWVTDVWAPLDGRSINGGVRLMF